MTISKTASILGLLCVVTGTAIGGVHYWTPVGPDGGRIVDISVDASNPGTLYVATFNGVHKSTDNGASWIRMSAGIPGDDLLIGAVAVSPSDPTLVLAATRSGYIYRSSNAAHSWAESSNGVTPVFSGSPGGWIRFDPATASTVYAGFPTNPATVYRSTNSGVDWTAVTTGLTGTSLQHLAVTPTVPPTLYAVTGHTTGGIFMSTDSGDSWTGINGDLPVPPFGNWVDCAAADSGTAARIYAVGAGDGEVYRSDNNGTSWTALTSSSPSFSRMWVHPDTGHVYGVSESGADPWWKQISVSIDNGTTWGALTPGHFEPQSIAFDPANTNRFFVGMSGGFYSSTNGGTTWTSSNNGLRAIEAMTASFSLSNSLYLYLGSNYDGFFRSTDAGLNTTPVHGELSMPCAEAIAVHPTDPQTVLTDSYPPHYWDDYAGSGMVKSDSAGDSWTRSPNPMNSLMWEYGLLQAWDILYDPNSASVVYAMSPGSNDYYGEFAGVFKSTDGGDTFSHSSTGLPTGVMIWTYDLEAVATATTTLYLATTPPSGTTVGLYKSVDAGATWTGSASGLLDGLPVHAVAVHPTATGTVLAGANDGTTSVFKSVDGGTTWAASSIGLVDADVRVIMYDPDNPATVYVGTTGDGVYRSIDGGATWAPLNDGLESQLVWDLVIDPAESNHLIASTRGGWYEIEIDPADTDRDGAGDNAEDAAPNDGDGNNDGTNDKDQSNVASLPLTPESAGYVTIVVPEPNRLALVETSQPPSPGANGVMFPVGLTGFKVVNVTAGGCIEVEQLLPLDTGLTSYYTYGPGFSPDSTTPHWQEFSHDGTTGAQLVHGASSTLLTLDLCDGQRGDHDLVANGVISHAGGPTKEIQIFSDGFESGGTTAWSGVTP